MRRPIRSCTELPLMSCRHKHLLLHASRFSHQAKKLVLFGAASCQQQHWKSSKSSNTFTSKTDLTSLRTGLQRRRIILSTPQPKQPSMSLSKMGKLRNCWISFATWMTGWKQWLSRVNCRHLRWRLSFFSCATLNFHIRPNSPVAPSVAASRVGTGATWHQLGK